VTDTAGPDDEVGAPGAGEPDGEGTGNGSAAVADDAATVEAEGNGEAADGSESKAESESAVEAESESKAEPEPESKAKSEPESKAGEGRAKADPESKAKPKAEPKAGERKAKAKAEPVDRGPASERGNPWLVEVLLALEIVALVAFAVSRPILDSFGRSPETFVARGADSGMVVRFGLFVALVPPLAVVLLGPPSRALGRRARSLVHLGLIAVAGGFAVWRLGQDVTGWPPEATKLILAGFVLGPALAALRWRVPTSRTFLRFAGAASVIFLVQFLVMSPASSLVFGDRPAVDDDVAADVSASLIDDPPNVVVVVFDALPTMSLLDGQGGIDPDIAPNFAALAGTSTWYRNNSSVAAFTREAVPAIMTGRYPDPDDDSGSPPPDPENLFTLLGGSYDVYAQEQLTRMCPSDLCPVEQQAGLSTLLGDAVDLWSQGAAAAEGEEAEFNLPGALGEDRYSEAERWVEGQDFGQGRRPDLHFLHVVLPHDPWQFLPDGSPYEAAAELPIGTFGLGWSWQGTDVGRQRHLLQLQAADRLLGQILDGLREDGAFDDSMVVVTADHGHAFLPREPLRALSEANYASIAWTPLLVKAPGQARAEVDDSNVEVVDVVPTIAEALGIEIPWEVDGLPVSRVDERDPGEKTYDDSENNALHREDGEDYITLDAAAGFEQVLAADASTGSGPDAVWQRTAHGALVHTDVDDLVVGDEADGEVSVQALSDLGSIEVGDPLPIEVMGHTGLPEGTVVAYALNGTIGGVTEVEQGFERPEQTVHALVPPDLFVDGENELTAYVVEGAPGAATLHELDVRDDG
jgi:hypothetical protein